MKRIVIGTTLLLITLIAGGCKGKTVIQDNPGVAADLKTCEARLKEKTEYINTLSTRVIDLEAGSTTNDDAAVVIKLEGEVMEIKAGASNGPHKGSGDVKGNAKDVELYKAFVSQLKRSRGAIKKCYQHALKKNSALSSRTITLNINVDYKTSGAVKNAIFSPHVSDQFKQCMKGVAANWKLPAMPRSVKFNYNQTLTPE